MILKTLALGNPTNTMIGREVLLQQGWLILGSSFMALSGTYPSLDLKKSVRAFRVGDPVALKKQEWG